MEPVGMIRRGECRLHLQTVAKYRARGIELPI
jgi:hypothetical protein